MPDQMTRQEHEAGRRRAQACKINVLIWIACGAFIASVLLMPK